MNRKETLEQEYNVIIGKAIKVLKTQPGNLQLMMHYMCRLNYLNGRLYGMGEKE